MGQTAETVPVRIGGSSRVAPYDADYPSLTSCPVTGTLPNTSVPRPRQPGLDRFGIAVNAEESPMVVPLAGRLVAAVVGGLLVPAAWTSVIGTLIVSRSVGSWLTRWV